MNSIKESKFWKIAKKVSDFFLHWFGFDLIIISILIIGVTILVCFGNRSDFNGLVAPIILFVTALSIIQYTKETHRLRLSNKWLLDSNDKSNSITVRPILAPRFLEIRYSTANYISINLKNVGGGVAKNIHWSVKVGRNSSDLADKDLFWRTLNKGTLPKIWPSFGFRLTMFKKVNYDDLWKSFLMVEYDWEYGNNEIEIFPLDLDYYVSSDLSGNVLEMLDETWVHQKIREIAIQRIESQISE